jgi:hypothetical protein
LKRDRQATEARRFEDKRSYITPDGREVLYGADWAVRKQELWIRAGGRCERIVGTEGEAPVRCRSEIDHPHHKVKRSKGRDDRLEALEGLCELHHSLAHPEFKPRWTKRSA